MVKGDKKKVKNLFKAEIIGASIMLFSILVTKIYIYIDAEKYMDKGSDKYLDDIFHTCHDWSTII